MGAASTVQKNLWKKHSRGHLLHAAITTLLLFGLHLGIQDHWIRQVSPDPETPGRILRELSTRPLLPKHSPRDVFGACLMFKDDLHALNEWIAYHYTVLPLRYLYLGTDVGNTQDPRRFLEEWHRKVNLQFQQVEVAEGNLTGAGPLLQQRHSAILDSHHAFVDRQRWFIKACTQQMRAWGMHWVAYVDIDEYVTYIHGSDPGRLVSQSLQDWAREGHLNSSCYTIPRLRYGSLETIHCSHNDTKLTGISSARISNASYELTTLRFVQHARPNDFKVNRFGKVLMNVSALPVNMIDEEIPYSIHRPYTDYCGPAARTAQARLRANHYTGSRENFLGRIDDIRRTTEKFESLSQHHHGDSCNDRNIQSWLARFVDLVSERMAVHLLWQSSSR